MNGQKLFPRIQKYALVISVLLFTLALLIYPDEVFRASLHGLRIWFNVLFPTLLPFFIAAELMMSLGIVNIIGTILEPLMRPLFRVPGAGGFAMAVGLISGNPMGAKLTAQLRSERLISKAEGERLVSFTSNAGPLFIFGTVAIGFFDNNNIGIILAIAHYFGSLLVGLIMRYHKYSEPLTTKPKLSTRESFLINIRQIKKEKLESSASIGELLGDAVNSSVKTILMIGGFIMTFSVITDLLIYTNVMGWFSALIGIILQTINIPPALTNALLIGGFEITLGTQTASTTLNSLPISSILSVISFIIGFSGLSVHAQVISMLSKTDISYKPYLKARFFHASIAAIITTIICQFQPSIAAMIDSPERESILSRILNEVPSCTAGLKYLAIFIIFYWIIDTVRKIAKKPNSNF